MLSEGDRSLIDSTESEEFPHEFGYFYADEVPEGISKAGWQFLMELCQFRIYRSNPASMLDEAGEASREVWDYAVKSGLKWPGFERLPPKAFRLKIEEGDPPSDG